MNHTANRLLKEYSKGRFDGEFVEVAREDLPFFFGRMALLEEYYRLTRGGGDPERQAQLVEQLARHPLAPMRRRRRRGLFRRLATAFR